MVAYGWLKVSVIMGTSQYATVDELHFIDPSTVCHSVFECLVLWVRLAHGFLLVYPNRSYVINITFKRLHVFVIDMPLRLVELFANNTQLLG